MVQKNRARVALGMLAPVQVFGPANLAMSSGCNSLRMSSDPIGPEPCAGVREGTSTATHC